MRPLHISLNTAQTGCKPSSSVSSFTHSLQSSCPYSPPPNYLHSYVTSTFLQANTQSSPLLRSTVPNHLNLPWNSFPHHLSLALNTQKTIQDLTSHILSFRDTPHIHLTIIRSALSRLWQNADSQPALPMSQSHMSTHSGHRP